MDIEKWFYVGHSRFGVGCCASAARKIAVKLKS